MTPNQHAAMEKRRQQNLREAVGALIRRGRHKLNDTELWFITLTDAEQKAVRRAWGQATERAR